jgi:hypothetical protein
MGDFGMGKEWIEQGVLGRMNYEMIGRINDILRACRPHPRKVFSLICVGVPA